MVIPVISSTFASFYRMFGKVGAEKLPWLFIDEAGQALPQAAAGAIYRAKNVVIVGDPFQIEPVNTTPLPIIHHFRNSYGFTNKQIHPLLSVQIAADRINPIGTYISGYAKNDIWIGTPLKVHRRCVSPMFEIANHIAYNNSMFMATETPQDIPLMLQTAFYDVKGLVSGKHFCEAQAQVVLQLVNLEIMMHTALPDLYLISPFREVSTKLRQYLLKNLNYSSGIKTQKADRIDLINWLKSHLGTVHTFQGKQAQGVILCLGLDHQSEKAAIWASSKPNILNVAITRAKYRFSVVGDANIWLNKSFFNQLSALPITRMNNTY